LKGFNVGVLEEDSLFIVVESQESIYCPANAYYTNQYTNGG
jgi:hypothetical protein